MVSNHGVIHIHLSGESRVGYQHMNKEVGNEDFSASWGAFPLVKSSMDESSLVLINSKHGGYPWINHDSKINS